MTNLKQSRKRFHESTRSSTEFTGAVYKTKIKSLMHYC